MSDSAQYIAFVDQFERKAPWIEKSLPKFSEDDRNHRLNAKAPKILPQLFLPEAEYSIWMDSNIALQCKPEELIETYLQDCDIAVYRHPDRQCAYAEAGAVLTGKKDDPALVESQIAFYRKMNYPTNANLYYCGFIIRRHTPELLRFSLAWWEQIQWFSSRDQISFPFVLWRQSFKPRVIKGHFGRSDLIGVGC